MDDLVACQPADLMEQYSEWTPCAAFRIVRDPDGTYVMEMVDDLDLITRPGAA